MKKVLLAIAAVATITSCSQNEEFENPNQQAKIGFTSVVKKATRATDTTTDNLLAFTVSSYVTSATYDGTTLLGNAYMNGVSYTKANAASVWSTEDAGSYYWPSLDSEKKVQFFAYPTTVKSSYSVPTVDPVAPATGYPSISFEVNATPANQIDLVVAHAANVVNSTDAGVSADGKLTLDFKHVLTRVNFAYIPGDLNLTYTVTAISIADIQGGTAKYNFDASDGNWDLTGTTKVNSYSYDVKQSAEKVAGKEYYSLADADASWMLLPQKVNGKIISISYSTKQGEMEVYKGTKTVTLPANAEWEVGKNVLYILTLPAGAAKVQIDTKVNGWNNATETPESAK